MTSLRIPPKQPVTVPNAMQTIGWSSKKIAFSIATMQNTAKPIVSNQNMGFCMRINFFKKKSDSTYAIKIVTMICKFINHATGVSPINKSRMVPPPIDDTKVMINTPNTSSLLRIAENAPDKAKAKVPSISMISMNVI